MGVLELQVSSFFYTLTFSQRLKKSFWVYLYFSRISLEIAENFWSPSHSHLEGTHEGTQNETRKLKQEGTQNKVHELKQEGNQNETHMLKQEGTQIETHKLKRTLSNAQGSNFYCDVTTRSSRPQSVAIVST